MNVRLVVRAEAERDLREAFRWYERQEQGLGRTFVSSVQETFDSIRKNPRLYAMIHKEIRRALVRRFPFAVFYVVRDEQVFVLAVLHCRRNPSDWMSRM